MNDYQRVQDALQTGADPAMLCMTCPWDRHCITPPTMTADEVKASLDKAQEHDRVAAEKAKSEGRDPGIPVGTLLSAMTLGGRARTAEICPVLAMRLRTADGRGIVDTLKTHMQRGEVTP